MKPKNVSEMHHLLNRAITIACCDPETPTNLKAKLVSARKTLIDHRNSLEKAH